MHICIGWPLPVKAVWSHEGSSLLVNPNYVARLLLSNTLIELSFNLST